MIIYQSPYPSITHLIPEVTLPVFLFSPLGLPEGVEVPFPSSQNAHDLQEPLFSPPPSLDPDEIARRSSNSTELPPELRDLPQPSRPDAKPLSLFGIRKRAELLALGLRAKGWEKGMVLSVVSENQYDYTAAILGAHLVGVTTALHNPSYTARELTGQFELVNTHGVLASVKAWQKCKEALPTLDNRLWVFDEPREGAVASGAPGSSSSFPVSYCSLFPSDEALTAGAVDELWTSHAQSVKADDDAVYCFSSGTSGKPKAVRLSHGNLVANVIQATSEMRDRTHQPLLDRWSSSTAQQREGPDGWYNEPNAEAVRIHIGPPDTRTAPAQDAGRDQPKKRSLISKVSHLTRKLTLGKGDKQNTQDDKATTHPVTYDGRREVHVDILPQFHCYGLVVAFVAMHTNTPRFVLPRFSLPLFLHLITLHKITFAFIVPPILLALCRSPLVDHPSIDLSSLTRLASGAASLPTKLRKEIYDKHKIKVTNGYGMSEMSPIISLQMVRDLETSPDSVGLLSTGTEARVVSVASGQDVEEEEGEGATSPPIGELWLRGPQRMRGYLNNPAANESTFVNSDGDGQDWLRTGDIVSIDSRGYIEIHDRTKDVIKVHGFQVSPSELEETIIALKEVHDVAVIGVKKSVARGQKSEDEGEEDVPWAFCVPAAANGGGAADQDQVKKWNHDSNATGSVLKQINEHLARYKHVQGGE